MVWNTFALEDSAQLGVLHVVEAHERNVVRQILVEARARDICLDLGVTSLRYQRNKPRLKLPAAMPLALSTERIHIQLLAFFFLLRLFAVVLRRVS